MAVRLIYLTAVDPPAQHTRASIPNYPARGAVAIPLLAVAWPWVGSREK